MTAALRRAARWLAIAAVSFLSAVLSLWWLGPSWWSRLLAIVTFLGTLHWLARGSRRPIVRRLPRG